jgi:hypothetical protein
MAIPIHAKELMEADFRSLAKVEDAQCLSFFVEASPENSTRTLKALLLEARDRLGRRGLDSQAMSAQLAPVEPFLREPNLSLGAGQTFLALSSKDVFCSYVVPLTIRSRLVLDNRFCLKPLLPYLAMQQRYYVLAISENAARLFRCENQECREIHNDGLPASLKEALSSRDFSGSLQAHSSGVPGHRALTYHSHSGPVEEVHKNRVMYCRQLSAAMERLLGKSGDLLILACVKEFVPAFTDVNRYANLAPEAILGNPDRLSAKEIQMASQEIVNILEIEAANNEHPRNKASG